MAAIRLYDAEHDAKLGRKLDSREATEAYVRRVVNSPWWRANTRIEAVAVTWRGVVYTKAVLHDPQLGELRLRPKAKYTEQDILHELAHLPSWNAERHHHGPEYLVWSLRLTAEFLGQTAARRLLEAMHRHKVLGVKKAVRMLREKGISW